MITHAGCSCGLGPTRRGILQGGLATTVLAASAHSAMAQGAGSPTAAGVRAIDTHAHYFPQSYLDLVAGEGPRFKYEVVTTDDTFMIKSPVFSPGPLSKKFIDIQQRLADMDAQGVGVHALSLTAPMLYWADADRRRQAHAELLPRQSARQPDRHRDRRLPPDLRRGARPPSQSAGQPAACGRRAADPDRPHRPRLEGSERGQAPCASAEQLSAPLHLRHHLAFEADPGIRDLPGRRRPGDDR